MSAVKGAVLSLLLDAYQRRDKVGLITFRGTDAELALPPTSSVEAAPRRLETLPTGGRTPLAAGLLRPRDVLRVERLRDPRAPPAARRRHRRPGHRAARRPSALQRARACAPRVGAASVVVDCETGPVRLGLADGLGRPARRRTRRACEELGRRRALADVVRGLRRAA